MFNWFKDLFSFCPLVAKRKLPGDFIICGHRGAPSIKVENTISSFEAAIEDGANALEIDLCVTKDGEIVLWHDWNPDDAVALIREQGLEPDKMYKPRPPPVSSPLRRPVCELTADQFHGNYCYADKNGNIVEGEIPTFKEFCEWLKDQSKVKYVYLDIKVPTEKKHLAIRILNQIDIKQQVIIETFDKEVLWEMKKFYPLYVYSLDVSIPVGFVFGIKEHSSVDIAYEYNNLVATLMRPTSLTIGGWTTFRRVLKYDSNIRYKVRFLNVCTINDTREMQCLIKMGINSIQTDYPWRLKRITLKNL